MAEEPSGRRNRLKEALLFLFLITVLPALLLYIEVNIGMDKVFGSFLAEVFILAIGLPLLLLFLPGIGYPFLLLVMTPYWLWNWAEKKINKRR